MDRLQTGVALQGVDPPDVFVETAKMIESLGYDRLWVTDSSLFARYVYVNLTLAARETGLQIGPAVTNPLTRHPALSANAIATIGEINGGRVALGIGAGDRPLLELGHEPASRRTVREMVDAVRALLRGETVTQRASTFQLADARLHAAPAIPVPIYISASGPKMLQLAGEIADGVIVLAGLFPEGVRFALDHIAAGAERAGRSPEEVDVTFFAYGSLAEDTALAIEETRSIAAWFAQTAPHYCEMAGMDGTTIERIKGHYAGSEFHQAQAAASLVPEEMVRTLGLTGTVEDCREKLGYSLVRRGGGVAAGHGGDESSAGRDSRGYLEEGELSMRGRCSRPARLPTNHNSPLPAGYPRQRVAGRGVTGSPGERGTKIEARNLSKHFYANGAWLHVLNNVSMEAATNEFVSIIGPSGCGKSTLFNILAGLEAVNSGEVYVDGKNVTGKLGHVGYMPQKDLLMPWKRVIDNTTLGLQLSGVPKSKAREEARRYFPLFGLEGFERHYPGTLSGGMRQRAAFLRTVLTGRDILLLDEPFGALDSLTRASMQEWLLHIWDTLRKTIIFVTHDVDEALYLSDRVYVMKARPGHIATVVDVPFARPRDYEIVTTTEFARLKHELLAMLKGDSTMSMHVEELHADVRDLERRRRRSNSLTRRGLGFIPPVSLLAAGIIVWEIIARARNVPDYLLPRPSLIWSTTIADRDLLLTNTVPTLKIAVYGFLVSLALAIVLAIAINYSRLLERAVYPILIVSQTIPIIALAPILVVLLGFTILPKVIVVTLFCFFPIVVNTVDGFKSVDADLVNLMRTLGANRWQLFKNVEFPTALPFLFSGTKVAATYAIIGAIFGEWVGSDQGLGYIMIQKMSQLETADLFSALVIESAIGIGLFASVVIAERLLMPWYHTEKKRNALGR